MLTTRCVQQLRCGAFLLVVLTVLSWTASCAPRSPELPPASPASPAAPAAPAGVSSVDAASKPVTDKLVASEEEYQGWRYYHLYCSRCHGEDVLGSTQAPDLRKSVSTGGIGADSFFVLVRDGSTENKEMKGFHDVLDDFRIRQIHAYVIARSENRLVAGRPKRAGPPPPN